MRSIRFLAHLVFGLLVTTAALADHGTYERLLEKPYFEGYPVSWCLNNGHNCGKPAADRYCVLRGFDQSIGFERGHMNVPTKFMTTAKTCVGRHCSGFAWVRCAGERHHKNPMTIPTTYRNTELMQHPGFHGDRLDSCNDHNINCSWNIAHEYCKAHGFLKAVDISRARDVGVTRSMMNGETCETNEGGCNGYYWIRCERHHRA